MSDYDTNIRIGMTADLSGGVQTEKQYDRLKDKAKDLEKANREAGEKGRSAMERFRGSMGKLMGVFGALSGAAAGFVSIYKTITAQAEATRNAIEKTKADALARSLQMASKEFADLKKSAAEYAEKMADAEKAQQGALANARALRDAQLKLAEANEIAAIGNDDKDRGLKIQRIQQKYGSLRGGNAASDQLEDIQLKRKANAGTIAANAQTIAELESQAAELADDEFGLRRRAQASFSTAMGILRKKNWMGMEGRNFLGMSNGKKALAAANKSEELSAAADAVKKDREDILESVRKLKRANAALAAENDALDGQRQVVETNRAAEQITERTSGETTAHALAERTEKREEAEAKRKQLTEDISSGESKAASLRRQIAFHQRRYAAAEDAQSRAGFALATADTKDEAALQGAQNAKYQADRTVAEFNRVLSELTAKLRAVEEGLKRDRSRLASAKEEATGQ